MAHFLLTFVLNMPQFTLITACDTLRTRAPQVHYSERARWLWYSGRSCTNDSRCIAIVGLLIVIIKYSISSSSSSESDDDLNQNIRAFLNAESGMHLTAVLREMQRVAAEIKVLRKRKAEPSFGLDDFDEMDDYMLTEYTSQFAYVMSC